MYNTYTLTRVYDDVLSPYSIKRIPETDKKRKDVSYSFSRWLYGHRFFIDRLIDIRDWQGNYGRNQYRAKWICFGAYFKRAQYLMIASIFRSCSATTCTVRPAIYILQWFIARKINRFSLCRSFSGNTGYESLSIRRGGDRMLFTPYDHILWGKSIGFQMERYFMVKSIRALLGSRVIDLPSHTARVYSGILDIF